jgi:LemA protein
MTGLALVVLVVLIGLWLSSTYNSLIKLKISSASAFSDIDVQLKQRHDLIPNLVSTVQGYAKQEEKTLTSVIAARNAATSAQGQGIEAQQNAENQLSSTLRQLFALSESYPDLKSSEGFLKLQGELADLEEQIESARRYYNAVVRDFNTAIAVFPTILIAGSLNFKEKSFFELDTKEERMVPQVSFGA